MSKDPTEWLDEIIRGKKVKGGEARIKINYAIPENGEVYPEEVEVEYEGVSERFKPEEVKDYVPFILYRLRSTKGVCLIVDEAGRRRYLPRIIVEAMKAAGRKIKEIACAPSLEELKMTYG